MKLYNGDFEYAIKKFNFNFFLYAYSDQGVSELGTAFFGNSDFHMKSRN